MSPALACHLFGLLRCFARPGDDHHSVVEEEEEFVEVVSVISGVLEKWAAGGKRSKKLMMVERAVGRENSR